MGRYADCGGAWYPLEALFFLFFLSPQPHLPLINLCKELNLIWVGFVRI